MASIVRAVRSGDIKLIDAELRKPGFCINSPTTGGRTALHHAIDAGKIEVCKHLISRGADPDLEDEGECTPVYIAILKENKKMIEFLLEQGANKKGKSPDGDKYIECTENEAIKELFK
ncbi:myotrophin [Exaiptasia diaphana]|uniref:Myotrophin n=1 Tax=Exaiptasia diaphana TaxID=2652724 RepID=A0A913YBT8_EXADI|nr:myotrophin [Exaiptasia diaphana]KXJ28313.1 Myotrophin [Exaiptasia diaphana]